MIENKLPTLACLLRKLHSIPYLASKNIYKVAHYLLSLDEQGIAELCETIKMAKKNLNKCVQCFSWQEKIQGCLFCNDNNRNATVICVVETWHDLIAVEKTGGYAGVYHVLGGALYPLEGIGPEDLTIEELVKRVEKGIEEIIFATNQTPEGEATAMYIAQKIKHVSVKISCLARGMPIGSSLEALDRITVFKALSERRPF